MALIVPIRVGLMLLMAGSLAMACERADGVNLVNRTDVPLAIGFSNPVGPCSERFLSLAEIKDVSRSPAEGAWIPTFAVNTLDANALWIVVTDRGTVIGLDPPEARVPCGGQPADWSP